jgi:hypothetical protein
VIQLGVADVKFREPAELSPLVAQALSETAAWCSHQQSLSHELRSPELDPSVVLDRPHFPESREAIKAWIQVRYNQYRQAVSQVTGLRSNLLAGMNVGTVHWNTAQAQGRLLIYFPMETVSCGASNASSHGFYDGEDAPPWDTWFWYSDGAILSWVPNDFISRAQAGIDANPVDCIHWTDWRELPRLTR